MRYRALAWMGAAFAFVAPAFCSSNPIPGSLANQLDYINFTSSPNPYPSQNLIGPYGAGYGGAFQPNISATADGTGATLTTVWCVDYQLDVTYSSQYPTYITSLNDIQTPTDPTVRYGNLPDPSNVPPEDWINSLNDPTNMYSTTGGANTAAYRYTLAAALVSQYVDSSNVVDPTNPDGNSASASGGLSTEIVAKDQAIQEAIWYITANNDYPGQTDPYFTADDASSLTSKAACNPNVSTASPFAASDANSANYQCWVGYAEQNVASVNQSMWAVVSGPATSNGVSDPTSTCPACSGYNSFQTFLVQLSSPVRGTGQNPFTPEPGFYGALGIGLTALFCFRRKKKV